MILCSGEALIDMLPRQLADGEAVFAPHAGGAVFNTALALGRLGVDTGFFSGISTDLFGAQLVSTLTASKVATGMAVRSPRPTTLAFVEFVDGQAKYAFYDENTAGRMLGVEDLPKLPDNVEAMFFGGISLVAEPCGTAYEALMLREASVRVTMIDPNIRPSFISDEPAYRARLARMMAVADIVKLSDDDLHWLMGHGDTEELSRRILAAGAKLVLITEGAKGAHGFTSTASAFAPAKKVDVADTVGAGDTFNAGALVRLNTMGSLTKTGIASLSSTEIGEVLLLGIRAAAVTVSRPGANPPWLAELA
ncbi:MAG: carbohydrate kinase [Paracoccaceae bacterium]|nr:carbohydrate kinase [Paracoccaceae bacterium]